jgi:hypothetical protein
MANVPPAYNEVNYENDTTTDDFTSILNNIANKCIEPVISIINDFLDTMFPTKKELLDVAKKSEYSYCVFTLEMPESIYSTETTFKNNTIEKSDRNLHGDSIFKYNNYPIVINRYGSKQNKDFQQYIDEKGNINKALKLKSKLTLNFEYILAYYAEKCTDLGYKFSTKHKKYNNGYNKKYEEKLFYIEWG